MKLRALLGEWEGESTVFLGAVDWDHYDTMLEDDRFDQKDTWGDLCRLWRDEGGWSGITDTREVDIDLTLPYDPFDLPALSASVEPNPEQVKE